MSGGAEVTGTPDPNDEEADYWRRSEEEYDEGHQDGSRRPEPEE